MPRAPKTPAASNTTINVTPIGPDEFIVEPASIAPIDPPSDDAELLGRPFSREGAGGEVEREDAIKSITTEAPAAAITVGDQGDDFAAQTGENEMGRADKPDGSTVLVSFEGHKWRREAGARDWVRAI